VLSRYLSLSLHLQARYDLFFSYLPHWPNLTSLRAKIRDSPFYVSHRPSKTHLHPDCQRSIRVSKHPFPSPCSPNLTKDAYTTVQFLAIITPSTSPSNRAIVSSLYLYCKDMSLSLCDF
jgi:hypothetical protein